MNLKTIIKSELLFESLEDRLKSTYRKWCKKMKLKDQDTLDDIKNADGYVEELDVYAEEFEDPYSEMYQKAEELYAKEDYEGILKMIADHQCSGVYIDREFKEWLSYRNLMKSSDIFQYKSERELAGELQDAKEKSFTKKLKKASAGEDFDKIWENDDMLIVVPKSHVGACKFGQGTRWCTASKQNDYFGSYYKKGILYRVLQKNDNYKELFSNLEGIKPGPNYDIENLSKVSINLRRKENYMSMVDKVDYAFGDKSTLRFLNLLPSEGYKAIKNYQSLNEQSIKKIIREEVDDFDWIKDRPQPSEGVVKLVIYLRNMILEYDVDFKNLEQFLPLVQDYAVEAVEGYMMPIDRIGLNGWVALNRYPSETQELKDGLNKLKKKVNSYL